MKGLFETGVARGKTRRSPFVQDVGEALRDSPRTGNNAAVNHTTPFGNGRRTPLAAGSFAI